jgi:hypothetical protein
LFEEEGREINRVLNREDRAMPIYDLICPKCRKKKSDVFTKSWEEKLMCDDCGVEMDKIPCPFTPSIFPVDGLFLEHVSADGKRFHSKKEMKKYAKENDLELGALG